jgi:hypothetical protein
MDYQKLVRRLQKQNPGSRSVAEELAIELWGKENVLKSIILNGYTQNGNDSYVVRYPNDWVEGVPLKAVFSTLDSAGGNFSEWIAPIVIKDGKIWRYTDNPDKFVYTVRNDTCQQEGIYKFITI